MVLESLSQSLPGWEFVIFIVLFLAFLIVGCIVTFIFFRNKKWNFTYVVLENVSGSGLVISRKGRARIIGFGDGGEEVFLLKELNKIRVSFGKRIGPRQVGWVVASDGMWYSFNFSDFDKKLLELGVMPTHLDVRLAMSAMRKGLEHRFEEKNKWDKIMPILVMGSIIVALLIVGGIAWYMTKGNVEVAHQNAEATKSLAEGMEQVSKTMASIDSIFNTLNLKTNPALSNVTSGSGLIIG